MQLTNYEQAVMLKECGYNKPVTAFFYKSNLDGAICEGWDNNPVAYNLSLSPSDFISRPNLHAVTDFLRTKGIHVYVECDPDFIKWYPRVRIESDGLEKLSFKSDYPTALSAAVTQALNILKSQNK